MYPSTSLFIAIGQLAIVVLVMFSYPLQVHPCRNCLDKVFHPEHSSSVHKDGEGDEDASQAEMEDMEEQEEMVDLPVQEEDDSEMAIDGRRSVRFEEFEDLDAEEEENQ